MVKTVTTVRTVRDPQGRTIRTVTVRRYTVAAVSTRSRAPAKSARAERPAKTKSAAAKARPVSTGGKRVGRGSAG